jgi:hypothetical protein
LILALVCIVIAVLLVWLLLELTGRAFGGLKLAPQAPAPPAATPSTHAHVASQLTALAPTLATTPAAARPPTAPAPAPLPKSLLSAAGAAALFPEMRIDEPAQALESGSRSKPTSDGPDDDPRDGWSRFRPRRRELPPLDLTANGATLVDTAPDPVGEVKVIARMPRSKPILVEEPIVEGAAPRQAEIPPEPSAHPAAGVEGRDVKVITGARWRDPMVVEPRAPARAPAGDGGAARRDLWAATDRRQVSAPYPSLQAGGDHRGGPPSWAAPAPYPAPGPGPPQLASPVPVDPRPSAPSGARRAAAIVGSRAREAILGYPYPPPDPTQHRPGPAPGGGAEPAPGETVVLEGDDVEAWVRERLYGGRLPER